MRGAQGRLEGSAEELISGTQRATADLSQTIEESQGYCHSVQTALSTLEDGTIQWCSTVKAEVESRTQVQVTLIQANMEAQRGLQQNDISCAEKELQQLSECLVSQCADVEVLVTADKERLGHDRLTLQQQKESLSSQVGTRSTVHGFLQELRQDVPTGMTLKKTEYAYPRELVRSRNRGELLKHFREQQEQTQSSIMKRPITKLCLILEGDEDKA